MVVVVGLGPVSGCEAEVADEGVTSQKRFEEQLPEAMEPSQQGLEGSMWDVRACGKRSSFQWVL